MNWDYTDFNDKYFQIEFDEGKTYRVAKTIIQQSMTSLEIDEASAVEMWLTDMGYLTDESQDELTAKAKENKSTNVIKAESTDKPKQTRNRVKKDNPDKEYVIGCIAEYLEELKATNIEVTNSSKIIEFTYNNKHFKLDLIEKREKKEK